MSKLKINITPSALSIVMDSGYHDFTSSVGISGLAKIEDKTLSLLAVVSTEPRTGQFRKFIAQAKRKFHRIEIIEVWNAELREILKRYGFSSDDGESFHWKH